MQPVKLLTISALLLASLPGDAAYVQSGKSNFVTASSTTCSPGSVTAGDVIVMGVQANTTTSVTISSTRVATWVLDQSGFSAPAEIYLFHGIATSSGTETITVSLTSGSNTIGSACAEYSNSTLNATSQISITTTVPIADIVAIGTSSSGSIGLSAPFTARQNVQGFFILGDTTTSSAGTTTATITGGGASGSMIDAFSPPSGPVNMRHRLLYQ